MHNLTLPLLYILESNKLHYFSNVMHYLTHYFSQTFNKHNQFMLKHLLPLIIKPILSFWENSLPYLSVNFILFNSCEYKNANVYKKSNVVS